MMSMDNTYSLEELQKFGERTAKLLPGEEIACLGLAFKANIDDFRESPAVKVAARLAVGVEGVGIAERAYQHARQYAHDRLQGRGADGKGPVPIIRHADVRRMLLSLSVSRLTTVKTS